MKKNKLIYLSVFALTFFMFLGNVNASCCYKNNGVYVYDATMSGSVCTINKAGDASANEATCKAKNGSVCCDTKTGTVKNGLTDTECASKGYKKVTAGTCTKIVTETICASDVDEQGCAGHGTWDKNKNCCLYTTSTNIDTSDNNAANINNPNNPNNPSYDTDVTPQERDGVDDWGMYGNPTDNLPDMQVDLGCEGMKEVLGLVKTIYNIIRYATPLVLIILGSVDFMKAVMSGKEDEIKKNQNRFISRLILAVGVFLLLSAFELITNILSKSGVDGSDSWYDCWSSLMIMFK